MVTFSVISDYRDSIIFTEVGIEMMLEYAAQYLIDGVSFVYTPPMGGYVNNNEAEYNATIFDTTIKSPPSWSLLTGAYFNSYVTFYGTQTMTYGRMQAARSAIFQPELNLKATAAALNTHIMDNTNPHATTKSQVGLGSVDNVADASKPVSSAQSTAIAVVASSVSSHTGNTSNPHSTTATQVGLGSVNNTADTAKPVSTAQTAAFAPISHTHAESDVTNLGTDMALKMDGANLMSKMYQANSTDSSSRVTLNLTNTGLSGGTALFNTTTPPMIILTAKKGATITDPNQVFHTCEEIWSNGNKTVSFIVAKGTSTGILVGGTVNSEALVGAGILVDAMVVGVKP